MKKIAALACAVLCSVGLLAGCGNSNDSAAGEGDETYQVGVIQLVQHVALDAATEGFQDALTEKLGDSVTIDVQNASGDSNTCATIANQFVSSGVDLIMANATPALQAAYAATETIPIVATSVTDYGTALDIANWTGVSGMNVSGTSDLAPLEEQAAMIKELFPDAKNVGLIFCSGEANSKYQIENIKKYLSDYGYTCTEYSFADSNEHIFYAVCLQETIIGYLALHQTEDGYELGYCFHSDYHGKGYAKESISAVLANLKKNGEARITAGTALQNTPSVSLLLSLGFRQIETEKVSFYKDTEGNDIVFDGGIFELIL